LKKRTAASELEARRFKIFGVEFVYLYLFGIALAFIGFVAENIARLIGFGILDSRFHILPFISPYALIVFALHLLILDPDDLTFFGRRVFEKRSRKTEIYSNIICYLVICAFVFLGELAVGNLWDLLFGVQLWNYSSLPLSVTQYAGLVPTLGYGTGAYLILKFVYKPTLRYIRRRVSFRTAKIICLTLGVLIVLDTLRLILMIAFLGEAPIYWMIKLW
jgi:uncharacterized membrane protein